MGNVIPTQEKHLILVRMIVEHVEMEDAILMKIVKHVPWIVLIHANVLMVKFWMIQMYVYHTMFIVNQIYQGLFGMEQHVNVRLSI
jgi:hypothetical protein